MGNEDNQKRFADNEIALNLQVKMSSKSSLFPFVYVEF